MLLIYFQGDYIKHPVLYELSHKYGFTDNLPESALPDRLEEIKEAIRREIRKELKVRDIYLVIRTSTNHVPYSSR